MTATSTCSSCGGTIELFSDAKTQIIATGDRFYHQGCIEVHEEKYSAGTPSYQIPRSW